MVRVLRTGVLNNERLVQELRTTLQELKLHVAGTKCAKNYIDQELELHFQELELHFQELKLHIARTECVKNYIDQELELHVQELKLHVARTK